MCPNKYGAYPRNRCPFVCLRVMYTQLKLGTLLRSHGSSSASTSGHPSTRIARRAAPRAVREVDVREWQARAGEAVDERAHVAARARELQHREARHRL